MAAKFSGDFELVNPVDNRSQYVVLPVRKNEIIGELLSGKLFCLYGRTVVTLLNWVCREILPSLVVIW